MSMIQRDRRLMMTEKKEKNVSDLFTGYLACLATRNAPSYDHVERVLNRVQDALGNNMPINEVSSESICNILAKVYMNGSKAHAAWIRQLLNSVWRWGMRVSSDYRIHNAINYGINCNPVESIPSDTHSLSASRERFLSENELPGYLRFLQNTSDHPASGVLLIALLTGSRIEEIANMKVSDFDNDVGTIYFPKTKTGNSHKIGLGQWAWSILHERSTGKLSSSYIFPSVRNQEKSISNNSIYVFFCKAHLKNACPRDSRRTFKTLAQVAGLKREILDLIQNHRDGTIASKHYDKFFATPEAVIQMRDALNVWERWLLGIQRQKMVA